MGVVHCYIRIIFPPMLRLGFDHFYRDSGCSCSADDNLWHSLHMCMHMLCKVETLQKKEAKSVYHKVRPI